MKTAYIAGGTGFIGHHLARRLKSEGYWVRVVDIEPYKYGVNDFADEIVIADLRDRDWANATMRLDDTYAFKHYPTPFAKELHFDEVYNLACLMGGMGFIGNPDYSYDVMVGSTEMTLNVLQSAIAHKAKKIFYSSSACVYNENLQKTYRPGYYYGTPEDYSGLREKDAYPSMPDLVYGWQKLFSEQLHQASKDLIDIRIARFHNIYGPEGTYKGGKEKAPAAMCRKVVEASDFVEVWGTGNQTRSFLYIDDCIDAVRLLMKSDFKDPINIGSEEMISINGLAEMAIGISGKRLVINNIKGPVGVMGRNSNNDLIREKLNWNPKFSLREGMERTFSWINQQVNGI